MMCKGAVWRCCNDDVIASRPPSDFRVLPAGCRALPEAFRLVRFGLQGPFGSGPLIRTRFPCLGRGERRKCSFSNQGGRLACFWDTITMGLGSLASRLFLALQAFPFGDANHASRHRRFQA